jgi:hypothetical protein
MPGDYIVNRPGLKTQISVCIRRERNAPEEVFYALPYGAGSNHVKDPQ